MNLKTIIDFLAVKKMQRPVDSLPSLSFLLIIASFTLIHIPKSFCQDRQYVACGEVYRCGNSDFTYPFWGGNRPENCGYPGFVVTCQGNVPRISVSQILYRILDSPDTTAHHIRVARDDIFLNNCPTALHDTILNFSIFNYSNTQNVFLFYGCLAPRPNSQLPLFACNGNVSFNYNFFVLNNVQGSNDIPDSCAGNMTVPIDAATASNLVNAGALTAALMGGFTLEYEANNTNCQRCSQSGGRCGYNTDSNSFICYCADRANDLVCNGTSTQYPNGQSSWLHRRKELVIIGLSIGIPLIVSSVGLIYYLAKRYSWWEAAIYWKSNDGNNRLVEEFMRNYGSIAPKQYTYSEIKKMTNSFADKLGHGGYGCVYRGKLSDGRLVAVKVLNDNKGNGQEFINEVATISRTSHVNVVTLLGFCYNRNKRALIYEFMPNGSLDKFICKKGPSLDITKSDFLGWQLLYEIAVGIARGLEYLHRGCNSRIVHFDIKPQNILLDADFCPKISDFGLAKLCQRKESVLSTLSARGTIGYIAPEVFLRNVGGVSHKSDVYSYGMMVIEMVGLRRKPEIDSH